jgi:hypothetical protein
MADGADRRPSDLTTKEKGRAARVGRDILLDDISLVEGEESSRAPFDIAVEIVTVQEYTPPVPAGMELAESDEVVDAVLAATQPLSGLRDIQPRRDDWSTRRDKSSSALRDLGELLVCEPDRQLDHRAVPSTRDWSQGRRCVVLVIAIYDHHNAKPSNEFSRHQPSVSSSTRPEHPAIG